MHFPDRKMTATKWQFLTVSPATLLTDLQLGYQAVRRFPGGKQTTEVAAASLARPSDKPHFPLYLLSLSSLLSPRARIETHGTTDESWKVHHLRPDCA